MYSNTHQKWSRTALGLSLILHAVLMVSISYHRPLNSTSATLNSVVYKPIEVQIISAPLTTKKVSHEPAENKVEKKLLENTYSRHVETRDKSPLKPLPGDRPNPVITESIIPVFPKNTLNEVKEGEKVNVNLTYFDHDKKRLHLKMEMISQKTNKLSASMEWISLYIDLSKRKVTEFEDEKIKLMRDFIEQNKSKF